MANNREKNRWLGIIIGPAVVFFALSGLWKNETRFDYHRAASSTTEVNALSEAKSGELFSMTGPMDQGLSYPGTYIDTFSGYLVVWRSAQIYAWDKDEDDDGVTWTMRWMSSVESNSRNSGVRQELSSGELYPPEYQVGDLTVDNKQIEFVDDDVDRCCDCCERSIPNLPAKASR